MDSSSKKLLNSINKLKECFSSTTASLAPYTITGIPAKKNKRVWTVEGGPKYFTVKCSDGSIIKQFWHSKEDAQRVCDEYNRKSS